MGKVKTRLAKTIGDKSAFEVYKELVNCTENATNNQTIDKRIYFSDSVVETKWQSDCKTVQSGIDLGERMQNAFADGFNLGYESIILIGSDLPDISNEIIETGFKALEKNEVVF